jgi:hypothetical protein
LSAYTSHWQSVKATKLWIAEIMRQIPGIADLGWLRAIGQPNLNFT